jgi:hypothetical protein
MFEAGNIIDDFVILSKEDIESKTENLLSK